MDEPYLEVRQEDGAERIPLVGDRLTLGRTDTNDISFPADTAISRSHAIIERVAGGWQLRDVGSSNGTFVNGERIDAVRILQPGDEVVVGESRVLFQADRAGASTEMLQVESRPARPAPRPPSRPPAESPPGQGGYLDVGEEWRAAAAPADAAAAPAELASARAHAPPAPATPQPPPAAPVQPARGQGHVRGVARAVNVRRTEEREVLSFRVDSYDESGNRLQPVAVEFMDYRGGMIGEGEEVEVFGRWERGTLRAKRIVNLSTHAEARGIHGAQKVALIVVLILILCFIAFIVISGVTSDQVSDPFAN